MKTYISKHLIIAYTNGETEGLTPHEIELLDDYFTETQGAPMQVAEEPSTVFELCALTGLHDWRSDA